jgi:hypothetical protein
MPSTSTPGSPVEQGAVARQPVTVPGGTIVGVHRSNGKPSDDSY